MVPAKEKAQFLAKEAAAKEAVSLVKSDMILGLGTGSSAELFIELLGRRFQVEGLKIQGIPTSKRSEALAKQYGIPLLSPAEVTEIDLTVDGADEVDPKLRLIKGAGGALLREKVIASASKKMVVIVDPSKLVDQLGTCPLPVEILRFGYRSTALQIEKLGFHPTLRLDEQEKPYITDNENYILDLQFDKVREHPEQDDQKIRALPGVVETGFFFNLATEILVGFEDGTVQHMRKKS